MPPQVDPPITQANVKTPFTCGIQNKTMTEHRVVSDFPKPDGKKIHTKILQNIIEKQERVP